MQRLDDLAVNEFKDSTGATCIDVTGHNQFDYPFPRPITGVLYSQPLEGVIARGAPRTLDVIS
jgi:hypothetical protein